MLGKVERITVGEISTTDPIIFVGVSFHVIMAITASIKSLLETWKTGLEIKNFYAQAKSLGMDEEFLTKIEEKVTQTVDAAIDRRVALILDHTQSDEARKNELSNGLKLAHKSLMVRIENGMTVEIKAPKAIETKHGASKDEVNLAIDQLAALRKLASELNFPPITHEKLLRLSENDRKNSSD